MQTRLDSLLEALVNIAIGSGISFASNYMVFPLAGVPLPTAGTLFEMTCYFTVVSIARQYIIRRWFNGGFTLRKP